MTISMSNNGSEFLERERYYQAGWYGRRFMSPYSETARPYLEIRIYDEDKFYSTLNMTKDDIKVKNFVFLGGDYYVHIFDGKIAWDKSRSRHHGHIVYPIMVIIALDCQDFFRGEWLL